MLDLELPLYNQASVATTLQSQPRRPGSGWLVQERGTAFNSPEVVDVIDIHVGHAGHCLCCQPETLG